MMQFKDKGKVVEVWGWDAFRGDDDVLLGTLEKSNAAVNLKGVSGND